MPSRATGFAYAACRRFVKENPTAALRQKGSLWTVSAKGDPHRPSQILATRSQTLAEVQHAAKHEVEPSVIVRSSQAPRSMWCYSLPHLGCLNGAQIRSTIIPTACSTPTAAIAP
jgi:hypothetical protein